MLVKMETGSGGGGGSLEFQAAVKYAGGIVFKKEDLKSCEIKVNVVDSVSYPLQLVVGSSYLSNATDLNNWTVIKSWTTATSSYEDVLSSVGSYSYFGFKTGSNSQTALFEVKCS